MYGNIILIIIHFHKNAGVSDMSNKKYEFAYLKYERRFIAVIIIILLIILPPVISTIYNEIKIANVHKNHDNQYHSTIEIYNEKEEQLNKLTGAFADKYQVFLSDYDVDAKKPYGVAPDERKYIHGKYYVKDSRLFVNYYIYYDGEHTYEYKEDKNCVWFQFEQDEIDMMIDILQNDFYNLNFTLYDDGEYYLTFGKDTYEIERDETAFYDLTFISANTVNTYMEKYSSNEEIAQNELGTWFFTLDILGGI